MSANRLAVQLKLTISGTEYAISSGNLKNFDLVMDFWGWEGTFEWWFVASEINEADPLVDAFTGTAPLVVALSIDRTYDREGRTADPLQVKGLVLERQTEDRLFPDVAGQPVLQRRYWIRSADRAQSLWREHQPTAVYAAQSAKQVIEAQLPDGVTVAWQWPSAQTTWRIWSFHLATVSFYDWLHWLLDREDAALIYDYSAHTYQFRAEKSTGTAIDLPRDDVARLTVHLPNLRRAQPIVLNGSTEVTTAKKELTNAQNITGVKHEYLIISPLAADLDARGTLETQRWRQPEAHLEVTLARYPSITLKPGQWLSLGEDWGTALLAAGKTYRVTRYHLQGRAIAQEPTDDDGEDNNRYEVDAKIEAEATTDPVWRRPSYRRPDWPFYIEGKVVSTAGQDDEATYQIIREDDTSLDFYEVELPLWQKKVKVPYLPNEMSGHFYFPLHKGQRVRVGFDANFAWIDAVLDWRIGAPLPQEDQGEHLVMGKKGASQTEIEHLYADGKPKLTIKRTSDADKEIMILEEGILSLYVGEESS